MTLLPDDDRPLLPADVSPSAHETSIAAATTTATTTATAANTAVNDIADLSLAAAIGQLLIRPLRTLTALNASLRGQAAAIERPVQVDMTSAEGLDVAEPSAFSEDAAALTSRDMNDDERATVDTRDLGAEPIRVATLAGSLAGSVRSSAVPIPPPITPLELEAVPAIALNAREWARLGVVLGSIGLALFASYGMWLDRTAKIGETPLPFNAIVLLLAGIVFGVVAWPGLRLGRLALLRLAPSTRERFNAETIVMRYGFRLLCFGLGLIAAAASLYLNVNEKSPVRAPTQFTTTGILMWVLSIVGITLALHNRPSAFLAWFRGVRHWSKSGIVQIRITWTLFAMVAILLVGGWLRFSSLGSFPPDMTSDHLEKARDAFFIYEDGYRPIFLENNGGREPAFFYFIAIVKGITGLPWGFELIKFCSGLWGMLMIVVAYWMGRAVIGEEDRGLGNLTGVAMAALVATSYWHVMLSRLGLRIVTTPVVAGVLLIFLIRAIRYNRRTDWLTAGLILGAGLYFYQAVRILPLVVIVGFVLALAWRARSWQAMRVYTANMVVLVIAALIVFAPLGNYMLKLPELFWQRTSGRLAGEDNIEIKNAEGQVVGMRTATLDDRFQAFRNNLPVLVANLWRSAWMFNWQGDRAWITGSPTGEPELDVFSGTCLILGLGLILTRMFRRRDPADWLLVMGIFVTILPTALAVAYVIEVPSATRASAALPFVYLLAAFGIAVIYRLITQRIRFQVFRIAVLVVLVVGVALSTMATYNTYFVNAMSEYRASTLPHRLAGSILRDFANTTGDFGNAFFINYPNWLDHRAIAMESGNPRWNNGVLENDVKANLITMMQGNVGTPYELKPDRQLLFYLNLAGADSIALIEKTYPGGNLQKIAAHNPSRDFYIYTAPPVGCPWILENVKRSTICK